jgi:aldose sugar dehydrogenase
MQHRMIGALWKIVATGTALATAVLLGACGDASSVAGGGAGSAPAAGGQEGGPDALPRRTDTPELRVSTVADGFQHVWDLGFLPDGRILVTERGGRLSLLASGEPGAAVTPVEADFDDVLVRGEGGLMGVVIHPDFARTGRFTTCQTHVDGAGNATDVRLVTWELNAPVGGPASARRVVDPMVGGLPINPSGRHSGCRPTLAPDGMLLVGTGDAARANIAQDLSALGGKTLRIDLASGGPPPDNPFADAADPAQRLIWTYGHRNVQGVAIQPGTGQVYTAEHGPSTDDEVNVPRPGANYGWDPSQGGTVGGYDESVPMTDLARFPDAVEAVWSSGRPVEAICGAAFISGPQWGALDGVLAVGALRGEKLLLMTIGPDGVVSGVGVPEQFDGRFGRLRAVRTGPDGTLYVTTSNGSNDQVLRVDPV